MKSYILMPPSLFFSYKMFTYLEPFVNYNEYQNTYSVESVFRIFMGIILNLQVVLSSIDILTILILTRNEYGRFLRLLALLSISFTSILDLHYACFHSSSYLGFFFFGSYSYSTLFIFVQGKYLLAYKNGTLSAVLWQSTPLILARGRHRQVNL